MLSAADIVFLVDNSETANTITTKWLNALVTGDTDGDGIKDSPDLSQRLAAQGINDARYGVVAFGEQYDSNAADRFAHSEVVGSGGATVFDRLWSDGVTGADRVAQLHAALDHVQAVQNGGNEDGWDAIDHAIEEYDFRTGAVPVFVLVQNGEGRNAVNTTLTHLGVFSEMASKNVILDALITSEVSTTFASGFERLFDLQPYSVNLSSDIEVLGVEADTTGSGSHVYHYVDTNTNNTTQDVPTATMADALQVSFNGSNTGASGMVGTGKSVLIGTNISGGIGPSAAGYRAKSVSFSFLDLIDHSTGNPVSGATTITNLANPITIPFSLSFYGVNYPLNSSQLYVNQDGTITFGSAYNPNPMNPPAAGINVDLSKSVSGQTRPNNIPMIAPLWDDFTQVGSTAKVLTKSVDVDNDGHSDFVIQWAGFQYAADLVPYDPITFQAVLYSDGRIRFNYQDLDSFPAHHSPSLPPPNNNIAPDGDTTVNITGGISATVGIWNGAPDQVSIPAGLYVPGVQVVGPGAPTGFGSGEAADSYVRMAWDTGGAAYDFSILDRYAGGIATTASAALREAFIGDLGTQINAALLAGKVGRADDPIPGMSIDYGAMPGQEAAADGFVPDPGTLSSPGNQLTYSQAIDTTSNSIPTLGTSATKLSSQVFKNARQAVSLSTNLDLPMPTTLVNGTYIVELFFADIWAPVNAAKQLLFDVVVEGRTLLSSYDIFDDRGRITQFDTDPGPGVVYSTTELDVAPIGPPTNPAGVVKRFLVDVSDADGAAGLQIRLHSVIALPFINGLRILRADPPRVENVVVRGSTWADGVAYSYADVVPSGGQLKPIPMTGLDTIDIYFASSVNSNGSSLLATDLTLVGDFNQVFMPVSVSYNKISRVASWKLPSVLGAGKYKIVLSNNVKGGGVGSGGSLLDGDWMNLFGSTLIPDAMHPATPDNFTDDMMGRTLLSGGGSAGGQFKFFFSVLPGDYNQDGYVKNGLNSDSDLLALRDGNGDGIIDATNSPSSDATLVNNIVATLGSSTALFVAKHTGDYMDDEIVNQMDYAAWVAGFGSTGTPAADGNLDGIVNAADYVIWRDHFGDGAISAWSILAPSGGSGSGSGSFVPTLPPPDVLDMVISGSASVQAPYDFATGTYNGQSIDGSGNQLRTVPVGGADTISIKFSEDVNITADCLKLTGLYTATRPTFVSFSYDILARTGTWRFATITKGDQYLISLSDAVTNVEGSRLDGEWTNPASIYTTNTQVSHFPSGNGTAGGNFNFVATILPGDATLDDVIDFWDYYTRWAVNNGQWTSGAQFGNADFNGDGIVNSADLSLMMQNYGANLQNVWLLADLNGDHVVDDADRDILFNNWNNNVQNPTQAQGDLNHDGHITAADLDLVFAQYGMAVSVVS